MTVPHTHKWTEVDRAGNVAHCPASHCRHRSHHCLAPAPLSVALNLWIPTTLSASLQANLCQPKTDFSQVYCQNRTAKLLSFEISDSATSYIYVLFGKTSIHKIKQGRGNDVYFHFDKLTQGPFENPTTRPKIKPSDISRRFHIKVAKLWIWSRHFWDGLHIFVCCLGGAIIS